jgi:hypothetical protein
MIPMAVSDIDLLSRCAEFTLSHSLDVRDRVIKELQTSGRTSLVTALRMVRLQSIILAIGMFSLFESLLQSRMQWVQPFDQLHEYLKQCDRDELAQTFSDYRLAINVLKHGRGRSYAQLLARAVKLEFEVKPQGEDFFYEGDVSEVDTLINVDERFVRRCAALIQEASAVIRSKEDVWI